MILIKATLVVSKCIIVNDHVIDCCYLIATINKISRNIYNSSSICVTMIYWYCDLWYYDTYAVSTIKLS